MADPMTTPGADLLAGRKAGGGPQTAGLRRWHLAGTVLLAAVTALVAGCSTNLPVSGSTSPPQPSASGPRPAATPGTDPLSCRILPRSDVEAAMGLPVGPAHSINGGCFYRLNNGEGGVNFGMDIQSAAQARAGFDTTESGDRTTPSLTVKTLHGLGEQAFVVISHDDGASVLVLLGRRTFTLQANGIAPDLAPRVAEQLSREVLSHI